MDQNSSTRMVLRAASVAMFVLAVWLISVAAIAYQNAPTAVAYVGGDKNVVVTYAGTTIQAIDQINQFSNKVPDPLGPTYARKYCQGQPGIVGPNQRYLTADILVLSIGGGPANVCIYTGQSRTFGSVIVKVVKVGEVEARTVHGNSVIALSKVELSTAVSPFGIARSVGGTALLALSTALFGVTFPAQPRSRPRRPRNGWPSAGDPAPPARTRAPLSRGAKVTAVVAIIATMIIAGETVALTAGGSAEQVPPPVAACVSTPHTPPGAAQVRITSPQPGAQVGQAITVRGTARIGPGQQLWVFTVNPGSTGLNPQPAPAVLACDGTWSAPAFVGSPADTGKQFQILAVVASPAAAAAITAYLTHARQTGAYPGLPALPAGAAVAARLTVTRT